jgi:hypothetical protein
MPASSGASSSESKNTCASCDVHFYDVAQVLPADANVQRLFAQPRALALRTERVAAVSAHEYAHVQLVLLALEEIEEAADEIVE